MRKLAEINKRFDESSKTIEETLFSFNLEIKKLIYELTENGEDITFEDLAKLPMNEPIRLPSAMCTDCDIKDLYPDECCNRIVSTIVEKDSDQIMAKVKFEKGATLKKHHHSNVDEEIIVEKCDKIIVFETNGIVKTNVLAKGMSYTIPHNRSHQVYSSEGQELTVIFRKVL